jgi:GTP pyrophosphokinase
MVQLKYVLQNGDRVEIITKPEHKPNRDWLKFVKSASAKSKIQAFIREEERSQAIEIGKERLQREARALGINVNAPELLPALEQQFEPFKLADWSALYAAVGYNRISVRRFLEPVLPEEFRKNKKELLAIDSPGVILVNNDLGILFNLAPCCKPIWGDDIVGYTTKERGISIHRASCPHINSNAMPMERRVAVAWGTQSKGVFDVEITVTTFDQPGMISSISTELQQAGISIQNFNAAITGYGGAIIKIAMRVRDRNHLVEVMGRIRRVKGVNAVERIRGSVFGHKRSRESVEVS